MARGMRTLRLTLAAAVSFAPLYGAMGQSKSFTRPGRTVEFDTGRPLSVSVKAWPNSKSSGKDGSNCPLYGDAPLDSTVSEPAGGQFKLAVARDKKTYTVVYCHSQYVPRVDRDVPNTSRDGAAVIPTPAFMFPATTKTVELAPQLDEAIQRRVVAAFNDLSYLRGIDPEIFDRAMANLTRDISTSSERRAAIVSNFAKTVQAWQE